MVAARVVLLYSAVALVVAACFYQGLSTERVFFTPDWMLSDLAHFHIPLRMELQAALAEGRLPVWSRLLGTGLPVLAEGQVGALYPPNLLLHGLLPFALALNLSAILHFAIAGWGMLAWARALGLRAAPALLSALVAALCGYMVVHLKHLNLLAASAWAPFVLSGVERAVQRPGRRALVAIALPLAMMALAGSQTTTYFTVVAAGAYALCALATDRAGVRAGARTLLVLACAGLLAAALAAVQLAPTLELARQSTRATPLSWEEATAFGLHPKHLVLFFFPYWYGDPARDTWPATEAAQMELWSGHRALFWEVTAYVGWIPLALAALALVASRRPPAAGAELAARRAPAVALTALVCLLIALGDHGALGKVCFAYLPGFGHFRLHSRFLLYVDLALALLAGIGLHLALASARPSARGLAALVLLAASVADLALFGAGHNPVVPARRWLERSALARALAGVPRPFRIHGLFVRQPWLDASARARGWKSDLEPLLATRAGAAPNSNVLDGLAMLEAYSPLAPARLGIVTQIEGELLKSGRLLAGPPQEFELASRHALATLGLWNVTHLTAPVRLRSPDLEAVGEVSGVQVYRNRLARPRAFLAAATLHVRDAARAAALVRASNADPRVIVVEEEGGGPEGLRGDPRAPEVAATVTREHPDGLELSLDAPRAGMLYVSELHYPGWTAAVDGSVVPLAPAQVLGMVLPVPAGKHAVTLRHESRWLRHGLVVSLATLLALLLAVVVRATTRA